MESSVSIRKLQKGSVSANAKGNNKRRLSFDSFLNLVGFKLLSLSKVNKKLEKLSG